MNGNRSEAHRYKNSAIDDRFILVESSATFQRILKKFDLSHKKVLDIGCGYGEFLSHFGEDSMGLTTTKEEIEYAKKRGLNIQYGNVENIDTLGLDDDFDVLWANNLFEHLLSPHAFLMKLKSVTKQNTILILGADIIPLIAPLINLSRFRAALASNHVNFFTRGTLTLTLARSGWDIEEIHSYYFKSTLLDRLTVRIAPHIYVIAKNDSTFVYPEKKIKEWRDDPLYKPLLNITGQCDTDV